MSRERIGGPWSEATQLTDFDCQPSDWAPDGSGVLCTLGGLGVSGVPNAAVLVSRGGDVRWRYDPSTDGLRLNRVYKKFSRDGTTVFSEGAHQDGTQLGIWAIPVHGGAPHLVVAFDDPQLVPRVWLSVGPDHLYLTLQQADMDIWVADVEVER